MSIGLDLMKHCLISCKKETPDFSREALSRKGLIFYGIKSGFLFHMYTFDQSRVKIMGGMKKIAVEDKQLGISLQRRDKKSHMVGVGDKSDFGAWSLL